ncbi:hypothetical protein Lal_00047247 [Lupinus albus]|uniref:Putative 23S rRNA pseudouridine(955/2504/2580) synthase n=1 Tax=Lupinus albus TaxID=3870 RepID=A0A6A5N2S3_LUPAL|nr:putative 23S rRNA pseudouridine(955/2504/2580) synthase [Lupinus albus]KAF1878578.1 hypothetical protein Lal_00047247 [Lupinus albus]
MISRGSVLFFNLKPYSAPIPSPFLLSGVAMSEPHQNQSEPTLSTDNYPVPLSPPLPSISKQIELSRAMTASSMSTLFSLSTNHILYEDEWLIAVNKPQGIYCENVLSSVPTLLNSGSEVELHLANRLDRDTSGVMVITKSHKVAAKFVKAFTEHKVKKTYIALCIGVPPKWKRVTVRSGHGRSKFGMWRVYAASDVGRSLPGGSVVRDMETSFEVVAINGKGILEDEGGGGSSSSSVVVVEEKSVKEDGDVEGEIVVRAYPKSGRTHQIRLHCQYLGISIKGDVKYEGVCEWKGATFDAHHLHAETLSFQHPVTAARVLLRAPLPSWCTLS